MMYKVEFTKIALKSDGTKGSISQGKGTCYTDTPIEMIKVSIDAELKSRDMVSVINDIKLIKGFVIKY